MSVSADLAELQRLEAASPQDGGTDLSASQTAIELYAWLVANARLDQADEADTVELFARFSGATAGEVRAIATTLRRLGYVVASDRLRQIAGRRKRDLAPLR
jgi:hypothetical protein